MFNFFIGFLKVYFLGLIFRSVPGFFHNGVWVGEASLVGLFSCAWEFSVGIFPYDYKDKKITSNR